MRDAKITQLYEGTQQIQRLIVARSLLDGELSGTTPHQEPQRTWSHPSVLTKPVPDPAAGAERLGADHRLDRAASPTVINGNDEYALEAALQLVEAHGGEVVVLTMAPANGTETIRKALAMGAQRGILVTDEALAGADLPTTIRVLAPPPPRSPSTCCWRPGHVRWGGRCRHRRRGRPPRPAPAVRRRNDRAGPRGWPRPRPPPLRQGLRPGRGPMPAVISCTQALGAPRYPSLKGIMAARSREIAIRSLADLGPDLAPGRRCLGHHGPRRGPAPGARRGARGLGSGSRDGPRDRRPPRGAEDHLMPATILAVAEVADGALTKLSTEVATLARGLGGGGRRDGGRARRGSGTRGGRRTARGLRAPRDRGHQPGADRRGRRAACRRRDRPPPCRGRDPRRRWAPRPTAGTLPACSWA